VNRLARLLLPLLAIAQLLLAVPALASVHAGAAAAAACHHCPCCPDDASSMKDCLAACTLGAAIAPSISVVFVVTQVSAVTADSSYYVPSLAEQPLKPPPIA